MSGANWGGTNNANSIQNLYYDPTEQSISLVPFGNTIYLDLSNIDVVGANFNIGNPSFGTQRSFQADKIFQVKATGNIGLSNQSLFRLFSVNNGTAGGGNGLILDASNNAYKASEWVCIIVGFSNTLQNRAFSAYTWVNNTVIPPAWSYNYTYSPDNVGIPPTGSVQILAIPACFSACYSV
jgi:hypothetical protein